MQKKALRQLRTQIYGFKSQFTRLNSRLKTLEKKKIVIPASIKEVVSRGLELVDVISKATNLAAAESAMEELRGLMESMNEITPKVELLSRLPEVLRMMNKEIKSLETDIKRLQSKVKKLEKQGFSAAVDWFANLQNGLIDLKKTRDSVTAGTLEWEEDVMNYLGETFFEKLADVRQNLEKVTALSNLQQFAVQVNKDVAKAVKVNKKTKSPEAADLIGLLKEKMAEIKRLMTGKITEEDIDPLIEQMEEVFDLRNQLIQVLDLGIASEFEKMMKTLPGVKSPLMMNIPGLERLMARTYRLKTMFSSLPSAFALAE